MEEERTPELSEERMCHLKKVAKDLHNGHILSTLHLTKEEYNNPRIPMMIWMPLIDNDVVKDLMELNAQIIYEYYDKASPVSINGRPFFTSLHFITADEAPYFLAQLKLLQEIDYLYSLEK